MEQYQQFQRRARRVALGEAGRLALGFGLSSFHLAPQLVAAFRRRFPEVAWAGGHAVGRQYQLLLQGELQVGFVRLPVTTPLCGAALLSDRLVLAAPGALALRADDLMARFNQLPLLQLTPKRGRGLSDQSLRFIAAHRLTPNVVQQAGDIQTLLALVAAGVGVALLPHSITHIAPAGIDILPLSGEETSGRSVSHGIRSARTRCGTTSFRRRWRCNALRHSKRAVHHDDRALVILAAVAFAETDLFASASEARFSGEMMQTVFSPGRCVLPEAALPAVPRWRSLCRAPSSPASSPFPAHRAPG